MSFIAANYNRGPTTAMVKKTSLLLVAASLAVACSRDSPYEPYAARSTKAELHERVKARIDAGMLARTDGWVYAIDVALLMIFAANEGDEAMYGSLRAFALERLVLRPEDDPYTNGFVVWRTREGSEPDASGTTEALRIAEADGQYDITVRVRGGGLTGQADAIRMGLARALVAADEEHRTSMRSKGLLTRDARKVERKKPGQPKARKRFQFSKR